MRLVVFHYHLLPGGVTDVIVESLRAVTAYRSDIHHVRLVCGREENTEQVVERLEEIGPPVDVDVIEELDYTSPAESASVALDRERVIRDVLRNRYCEDTDFWWVHNYHVGKNPSFTLALCSLAAEPDTPPMLLHIHDFPEDGRYENLAYIERIAGRSPYPAAPHVHYAVINEADRRLLAGTEIPSDHIHLLVNPAPDMSEPDQARPSRDRLAAGLAAYASDTGQQFDTDAPILLYPVRTIRRKNILEAALLARLAGEINLVVTLPGISDSERPYSELVEYAYAHHLALGVWGIGRQEHRYGLSFEDMTLGADGIVSTSILEGFGLLYVNALRWQVPLFARRLPILTGIESVFDGYPVGLYDRIEVPTSTPSIRSMTPYLRMRYGERLDAIELTLPNGARRTLERQLEELLSSASVDYAFLPPQMQLTVLADLGDEGFCAEVAELNNRVVASLQTTLDGAPVDRSDQIASVMGYEAFASRFEEVLVSVVSDGQPARRAAEPERYSGVQDDLISRFANLSSLRLLLAPFERTSH